MNLIPPTTKQLLVDELNKVAEGLASDQIDKVLSEFAAPVPGTYDPFTHSVDVVPLRGGSGVVRVRVQTDYVGEKSGTGRASAVHGNDFVRLLFIGGVRTGRFVSAEVIGQAFSEEHKQAPAYAPWQQRGRGTVVVHPRKGAETTLGDAEYIDEQSNRYATLIGERHVEDHGSDHQVALGSNITEGEVMMREAVDGMELALDKFSIALE